MLMMMKRSVRRTSSGCSAVRRSPARRSPRPVTILPPRSPRPLGAAAGARPPPTLCPSRRP